VFLNIELEWDEEMLALQGSVNSILTGWKNDGTLDKVLNQWGPSPKKVNGSKFGGRRKDESSFKA
jgi:ABC-type amino acid transport substrate-binding protein